MFRPLRALAALVLGLAVMAGSPALAQPAMWVIRDHDSTIYLFGTVHLLKPETKWRTPKYDKAFASADEIWLEINDSDDAAALQSLVMTLGMDPANPLSKKLSADEYRRFSAVANKVGLPPAAIDTMKPWLAGITLSVMPMLKAGYDPNSGVESIIKADGKVGSKVIRAFETSEQQLKFFDSMPVAQQIEFLMSSVDDIDEGPAVLDKLVVDWAKGDIKALEDDLVTPMRDEYPALYKVLLVDRNAAWAVTLEERLKGSGVSFVAVGSAHLIGPDSVQALLAKRGIKAERF
ncbi:MAG TPA: TraB/GumN family protein [Caulobacter sp.]|nr:TraB/GumN family protein [Caulobacter sp.]